MNYQEKYQAWLSSPLMNEELLKELKSIKDNEDEKKLRFGKDLDFGTAGPVSYTHLTLPTKA